MTYELNQIIEFTSEYPEGLYDFVKENNYMLKEIEPTEESRRVQIVEIPQPTEEEIRESLNRLSLTKREVFLALYRDKGVTPEQLRATVKDPEALIEFDYATQYYRGNPLIDVLGKQLGYTTEDLDYLFINGELP